MNRALAICRAVASGACLAVAAGWLMGGQGSRPELPAAALYPDLPDAFAARLETARAGARGNDPDALRRLAHLYQANGLYREAQACYGAIAAAPSGLTPRDHYLLAIIARDAGDSSRAQTELRAVVAAEPRYIPARVTLGDALAKSGRTDEAANEYSAILAIEEDQPQAAVGLARIEIERGDADAAASRLESLMAAHPESASGAALFAPLLQRRGETDRATAMRQLSRERPEPIPADPWVEDLLGDTYDVRRLRMRWEAYIATGQTETAGSILNRIEAVDPGGPIAPFLKARAEARAHRDGEAVAQYRLALARGGNPEEICPDLARSLVALGRVSEAADLLAAASAKQPDSLPLAMSYADVAARQGDQRTARALLERILRREPGLPAQNMSLAKILWSSGERDEAARCLQRVADGDPADVASRALLGEYYLAKADPFAAVKPLEEARAGASGGTAAQQNLAALLETAYLRAGNAELGNGRPAEAGAWFDKAVRLRPDDLAAYAAQARVSVQLRQFRRAAEALEKMAVLDPGNPTIHLSLGDVIYQDGNPADARRHWEKARQLVAPGDSPLRDAIDARLGGRITADTFQ